MIRRDERLQFKEWKAVACRKVADILVCLFVYFLFIFIFLLGRRLANQAFAYFLGFQAVNIPNSISQSERQMFPREKLEE